MENPEEGNTIEEQRDPIDKMENPGEGNTIKEQRDEMENLEVGNPIEEMETLEEETMNPNKEFEFQLVDQLCPQKDVAFPKNNTGEEVGNIDKQIVDIREELDP